MLNPIQPTVRMISNVWLSLGLMTCNDTARALITQRASARACNQGSRAHLRELSVVELLTIDRDDAVSRAQATALLRS